MTDVTKLIEVVRHLEEIGGIPTSQVCNEKDKTMLEQNGLHGEVVACDGYRINGLDLKPEFVFDIGANVGFFTRHARKVFPGAKVVAVEPDPANFAVLEACTSDVNVFLVNKAIGSGQVYHVSGAANGSGESYISAGPGFKAEDLASKSGQFTPSDVENTRLSDIIGQFTDGKKTSYVLKIDCEGAENAIFDHPESVKCLQEADYLAMELHNYSMTDNDAVKRLTQEMIFLLQKTHDCVQHHVNLFARKR
jgi:FkbM family methyltransferase